MRSQLPNKLMSESPGQSGHALPIGHQPLRAKTRHARWLQSLPLDDAATRWWRRTYCHRAHGAN